MPSDHPHSLSFTNKIAQLKDIKIISRETVLSHFFDVEKIELTYAGKDEIITRYRVVTKGSAGILLFNKAKQTVVFSVQYRFGLSNEAEKWVYEIPAGILEVDESPENGIKRECLEETGYKVDSIEFIGDIYASPGYTSEVLKLYYSEISEDLKTGVGGGNEEEHEYITIVEMPLTETLDMIKDGRIKDAKTVVCLYWLKDKLAMRIK